MNIHYAAPPPFNGRTEDKPPPPRSPLINGISANPVTPERPVYESPHINGISATPVTPERSVNEVAFSTPHTSQASRILFNEVSTDPQESGAISDVRSVSPVRRLVYPENLYNQNGIRIDRLFLDEGTVITAMYPPVNFNRNINSIGPKKREVHNFLIENSFSFSCEGTEEFKYKLERHLSKDELGQIAKGITKILNASNFKMEFI